MPFSESDLVDYIRGARLAIVSSLGAGGEPQSALVGIGVTDDLNIIFDTTTDTRKHANLTRDPRASIVMAGPGEQTLQYEGLAAPVSTTGAEDQAIREAYYLSWPDGRQRLAWPNLAYWRLKPTWARYSDYARGPLIVQFFGAKSA
jgi:hypothetical protein